MTDDEEDIDIDIDVDIDGDEPEDRAQDIAVGSTHAEERDLNTTASEDSVVDLSENADDTVNQKESVSKQRIGAKIFYTDNTNIDPSIADGFKIPDWITQDYHSPAGFETRDMDEKSRMVIEGMLAEEAFYSSRSSAVPSSMQRKVPSPPGPPKSPQSGPQGRTIPSMTLAPRTGTANGNPPEISDGRDSKKRKNSNERTGRTKRTASEDSRLNAKLSSADLPSHNTRWTTEEDARLRQGIGIHGYGNWKAIAAVVGTRNPLQVKNHARHLAMSEKMPHDVSAGTSDGEGLDRRSSAANSGDEDAIERRGHQRRPRSKNIKRIDASVGPEGGFSSYSGRERRARSITSESGNEEYTGSEFGATSGYDTDNDDDRASKSPSLSARGSRSGSAGLTTPSPGLRPFYSALPHPYSMPEHRTGASSMDEDEDIDINIESTDEEQASVLNLPRAMPAFVHKTKSRSISPFSNSSTRSRLSSEFDSDSDRDLDNEDGDEIMESGSAHKRSSASSPALSDTLGSSSEVYNTPNFNTSSSSINSTGTGTLFKPLLKDTQPQQQQQPQRLQQHKGGPFAHISAEKITNSPKERRTVSFGAVHVAELKPDVNSYDEDDVNSSEDGGTDNIGRPKSGIVPLPSPLSKSSRAASTHGRLSQGDQSSIFTSHLSMDNDRSINDNINGPSPPLTFRDALSNNRFTHSQAHNQRTEDDEDDEEEGFLGTRINHLRQTPPSLSATLGSVITPLQGEVRTQPVHGSITPEGSGMAPPVTRRILDKTIITEEEKQVHSEFFCNKASKTPERYQRIRNTILQAWEKSPSTYLTKTSVRSGLKDCGDVNAIGRVHSWLESIGAINVGMTASSPGASLARPRNGGSGASRRRGHSEERGWSSSSSSSAPRRVHKDKDISELANLDSVWVTPPLRRRRVRNEKGEWVDPKELEGRVIEHNVESNMDGKSDRGSSRRRRPSDDLFNLDDEVFFERYGMTKEEMEEELEQERLAAQNAKYFAASEFQLVNRRLIMDFHSHMAETEVIGLLGGLYDEDERILFILGVFPCRSISTGLQCEMDPESDVEARYFFSSKGFVVVGWYHSHPTFEPNPSIRDIENQCEHQAMFRRHSTGVEPFVGVIVSPFDPRNLSYLSKFQFLTVSEQLDERLGCRIPFGFDREITRTNELSVAVFQQLSELVRYYRTYEHRVDLSKPLQRGEVVTRLEKLIQSLSHHIFVDENTARAFLSKVNELVIRGFHLPVDHDRAAISTASSQPLVPSSLSSPTGSSSGSSTRRVSSSTDGAVEASTEESIPTPTSTSESAPVIDNGSNSTPSRAESITTTIMDGVEVQQAVPEPGAQ
ncbi:Myb-like, SWIRM and MPN domains 1 [Mortierella sp. GBA43]|nr:Myb-like, SWIRM and MPN domains 1 [Mortierella sp. GBA43]